MCGGFITAEERLSHVWVAQSLVDPRGGQHAVRTILIKEHDLFVRVERFRQLSFRLRDTAVPKPEIGRLWMKRQAVRIEGASLIPFAALFVE